MGYGTSAVRLDIGREARIRTSQYFGIPGSLAPDEIVCCYLQFLGVSNIYIT